MKTRSKALTERSSNRLTKPTLGLKYPYVGQSSILQSRNAGSFKKTVGAAPNIPLSFQFALMVNFIRNIPSFKII